MRLIEKTFPKVTHTQIEAGKQKSLGILTMAWSDNCFFGGLSLESPCGRLSEPGLCYL